MNKKLRLSSLIFPILLLNLCLNLWGIEWGLPNRWHVDESVGKALAIGASHSLAPITDAQGYGHPALYELLLTGVLAMYIGILILIGYPIADIKASGITSWVLLAERFPEFAFGVYQVSRAFSAVLGMLTVWVTYRLAKKVFGARSALLTALSLSVTMGFVGASHFAKRDVLLGLLFILVLLYCVKTLQKGKRSYLLWSGFLGGLCIGTKHNGLIALFPIFLTLLFRWRENPMILSEKVKDGIGVLLLVLGGYLAGIPMVVTQPRYLISPLMSFFYSLAWPGQEVGHVAEGIPNILARAFIGPINYLIELASTFGVALWIYVLLGLYRTFRKLKRLESVEWIVLLTSGVYFLLIVNSSFSTKYALTKGILLIVPLLACYAGEGLNIYFRKSLLIGTVLYSLVYTVQADLVFVHKDTRYQATKWVRQNLPNGASIEITKQIDRVISAEILKDYRVIYLGKVIDVHTTEAFAIDPTTSEGNKYFNDLREQGPTADYIIESFEYAGDIEGLISGAIRYLPRDHFRGELLTGKYPYQLIQRFDPSSVKLKSSVIPYLCYVKPLIWNPVPQIGYVSPTIMVFKRKNGVINQSDWPKQIVSQLSAPSYLQEGWQKKGIVHPVFPFPLGSLREYALSILLEDHPSPIKREALLSFFQSPDPVLHRVGLYLVRKYPTVLGTEDIGFFKKRQENHHPLIQETATEVLGELGDPHVIAQDKDPTRRIWTMHVG